MFYHDHAYGITRLNVYAGEAAGYLLNDPAEQQMVTDGVIPSPTDPAGHPGQDLRPGHDSAGRRGPDLGRKRSGAARATSGSRTSTCRTRTRTTSSGANRDGAVGLRPVVLAAVTPAWRTGRSPNPCTTPASAAWRAADEPGDAQRRPPFPRPSWTPRWSTARPTRT